MRRLHKERLRALIDDWMASTGMAEVEATEAEIALDTMFSKAQQGIIMVFSAENPQGGGQDADASLENLWQQLGQRRTAGKLAGKLIELIPILARGTGGV